VHGRWEVSDEQWTLLEPILKPRRRRDGKGRPPAETRSVLNGVLWILGTGAQWRELPKKYPPYQTCHRRFQQWVRSGALEQALRVLAERLRAEGRLNLEEAFIDATFAAAKKGGSASALPSAGRGPRSRLSPLATVFLSPSVSKLLRRTKANSSKSTGEQLPRPTPGPVDWRQSLRQRSLGPPPADTVRHRDDRAPSRTPEAPDSGWTTLASLSTTLDGRAALRLAAQFSPPGHALGVPRRELLRHGPPRLHENHASLFLRPALVGADFVDSGENCGFLVISRSFL